MKKSTLEDSIKNILLAKHNVLMQLHVSIKQTCKRLGVDMDCEVPFQFSEKLKKQYDKKYGGIVDFIITPTVGPKVAIELDSRNKRLSYSKLEELSDRGYISYWLRYKISKTGRPYYSSYKQDCSEGSQSWV